MADQQPPTILVVAVQKWVDLRDERTRVQEYENNHGRELDHDTLRQFEQEQEDAAFEAVDLCVDWFNRLGVLR